MATKNIMIVGVGGQGNFQRYTAWHSEAEA